MKQAIKAKFTVSDSPALTRSYPYVGRYGPTDLIYLFVSKNQGICLSSHHPGDILMDGLEPMDEVGFKPFNGTVTVEIK